jgi:hypothetical protein
LLVLEGRELICLVELGVGLTAATADSCERTTDGRTDHGADTTLDHL